MQPLYALRPDSVPNSSTDVDNPFFVRLYRLGQRGKIKPRQDEHRRRVLEGIAGRVVEIGAGDGGNFSLYPPEVTSVLAIEPEPRLRALAAEAAAKVSVDVSVQPGTALDLPVETGSVDAVFASLVLCTVPDLDAALAEAHRVIRPGGDLRFYEHVHAERQPLRGFLEGADRSRIWPAVAGGCHPTRDTHAAIQAAGFTVQWCDRFMFRPSPISPRLPHILGLALR